MQLMCLTYYDSSPTKLRDYERLCSLSWQVSFFGTMDLDFTAQNQDMVSGVYGFGVLAVPEGEHPESARPWANPRCSS